MIAWIIRYNHDIYCSGKLPYIVPSYDQLVCCRRLINTVCPWNGGQFWSSTPPVVRIRSQNANRCTGMNFEEYDPRSLPVGWGRVNEPLGNVLTCCGSNLVNPTGSWDYQVYIAHSKIPWYPKLLFQRENALASFWVQRVLVGNSPRPSRVMIKHNFLLGGILELKLNPRHRVYVEIPKPSRVSQNLRQIP
jgi:hypothetical protein